MIVRCAVFLFPALSLAVIVINAGGHLYWLPSRRDFVGEPGHERAFGGRTGYILRSSGVIWRITSDPFSTFQRISASFCSRRSCCRWRMDVISIVSH